MAVVPLPCANCGGANAVEPVADALVFTGVRRVAGVVPFNPAVAHPGLQSVMLVVLAGEVNVSAQDGTNQVVPTGASLSWSVSDTDDTSLTFVTFAGVAADADYLVSFTYKATGAG